MTADIIILSPFATAQISCTSRGHYGSCQKSIQPIKVISSKSCEKLNMFFCFFLNGVEKLFWGEVVASQRIKTLAYQCWAQLCSKKESASNFSIKARPVSWHWTNLFSSESKEKPWTPSKEKVMPMFRMYYLWFHRQLTVKTTYSCIHLKLIKVNEGRL